MRSRSTESVSSGRIRSMVLVGVNMSAQLRTVVHVKRYYLGGKTEFESTAALVRREFSDYHTQSNNTRSKCTMSKFTQRKCTLSKFTQRKSTFSNNTQSKCTLSKCTRSNITQVEMLRTKKQEQAALSSHKKK